MEENIRQLKALIFWIDMKNPKDNVDLEELAELERKLKKMEADAK